MSQSLHVAIIMDGNGRWAKCAGRNRLWGHAQGAKVLKNIVKACPGAGIRYMTVYAFSSENWKRDPAEVGGLMALVEKYLRTEVKSLHANGVCLRVIGDRVGLSDSIVALIDSAQNLTKDNTRLGLQVALNYGGRGDLVQAMNQLARDVHQGLLLPGEITARHITEKVWTSPWPDPDLCIRTGGQMRLSNFLLWQMTYTELLFLEKFWPDFTPGDLQAAVADFHQRTRQFGEVVST